MEHELKILPTYFTDVTIGQKPFELRKDDRDYNVGDTIKLKEWDGVKYTGRFFFRTISYLLRNCPEYGLKEGFVIIGTY